MTTGLRSANELMRNVMTIVGMLSGLLIGLASASIVVGISGLLQRI